jgi:diacylglycerol kinase (ATP)
VFAAGFRRAVLEDLSVAYKVALSVPVLAVCLGLRQWVDFMLVLVATGQMLAAEIFNTALEDLCDVVQPDRDDRIGAVKDMAAAAAGLSILVWSSVILYELARAARRFL